MSQPSNHPLVSIVTPCLHPGEALVRCISNVAAQTYENIEHIVIDGGSSDGTVAILKSQKGIRWISEPDRGQTEALNKGFDLAKGNILTWLNADDSLPVEAVQEAVSVFVADPQIGAVYGDLEVVEHGWRYITQPPRTITWRELGFGNRIGQQGTFFSREAFEVVGAKLDEDLNLAMDFDLWVRFLAEDVRMVYVPRTLGIFPIHRESKTGSISQREFVMEELRVFLKHGRKREATICLGRAAAYSAEVNGRVKKEVLENYLKEFLELGTTFEIRDRGLIRDAARTQAAIIEARHTLTGFRFLCTLGPWRHPETRAKLWRVFRRTLKKERRAPKRYRRDGAGNR